MKKHSCLLLVVLACMACFLVGRYVFPAPKTVPQRVVDRAVDRAVDKGTKAGASYLKKKLAERKARKDVERAAGVRKETGK